MAVENICGENLAQQLLGTVPTARAQQQQVPTWDLNSFPLWHFPHFGILAAPPWLCCFSMTPSLYVCVCVSMQVSVMCEQCLPLPLVQVPQLVHPWPLQLFVPGGTSQRLWGKWNTHIHISKFANTAFSFFPIFSSFYLSLAHSLFLFPSACILFKLCVSLGACLQKDSHQSSSISELVFLTQCSCSLQCQLEVYYLWSYWA